MKSLFILLAVTLSTVAFAEGEGSGGENFPPVSNHNVVGGGCAARIVGSDSEGNPEIVYSGTCNVARGSDNTVSNYSAVYASAAAASAHCNSRDMVAARYSHHGHLVGYVCLEAGNSSDSSN